MSTLEQLKQISDAADGFGKRLDRLEKRGKEQQEFDKFKSGEESTGHAAIVEGLGKQAIDFVRSKMNLDPFFQKDYDSLLPSPGLGQFLPDQLHTVVSFLARGSGALLPRLNKITVEPEEILRLPAIAQGAATWHVENELIGTSEPVADELKLSPKKIGSIATLSLEAFERPNITAATIVGNELTRAISDTLEQSILSGTVATDRPVEGILSHADVPESAAAVGGWTAADILAFIQEALASYPGIMTAAGVAGGPILIMEPVNFLSLVSSESGSAPGRALVDSGGPSFMGIPIVLSPHCKTAGGSWIVMMKPQDYNLIGTSVIRYDADTSVKFTSAGVVIRLLTWASYGTPQPEKIFRGPLF